MNAMDVLTAGAVDAGFEVGDLRFPDFLNALPAAIYATDQYGRVIYCNRAAADLAGREPRLGEDEWCITWRLFHPDGTPMRHDECPMAIALKEKRPVRGTEILVERPDGMRVAVLPNPTPVFGPKGDLIGAVNMLINIGERKQAEAIALDNALLRESAQREIEQRRKAEQAAQLLAAIVEGSDDAIVSKDLNGIIVSWNRGAERIFGYTADEIIGKPVTVLFPADRQDEEPGIIERVRRGDRIEHYETIRRRKDGELIDVSLSVSPVRDERGRIVGASKIARDITERKKAEKERDLLVAELSHRVKNTLATVISIAQQSFSRDVSLAEARKSFEGRIRGLAKTHGRLADANWSGVRLESIVAGELSPYRRDDGSNVRVSGPDIVLGAKSALTLGMAFHELATNAAKYGALSTRSGTVRVEWDVAPADRRLHIRWAESGGPTVTPPTRRGFGRLLLERVLVSDLRGDVTMTFGTDGLNCTIEVPANQSIVTA